MLAVIRSGLRDSSLQRYEQAARSWVRYCAERGEPAWDASTSTLIRWLDSRARGKGSPASAIKISLAGARFIQRGYAAIHDVEVIPYSTKSRVQLDAWCRSVTLQKPRPRRARALRLDDLRHVIQCLREWGARPLKGHTREERLAMYDRDAALLLVGWWGALRSDDIARLEWGHVMFVTRGVELHIPNSKTGSAVLALAARHDAPDVCPVRALQIVLKQAPPEPRVFGFTHAHAVAKRVQTICQRAQVACTSHSLRAGFATECASQGISDRLVQSHGRWMSAQQHSAYVREGRLWLDTPTSRVSLTPQNEKHADE